MKKYIGLFIMLLGLIWLLVDYKMGLVHFNVLLIIPFLFILAGLFLYVFFKKRESIY